MNPRHQVFFLKHVLIIYNNGFRDVCAHVQNMIIFILTVSSQLQFCECVHVYPDEFHQGCL